MTKMENTKESSQLLNDGDCNICGDNGKTIVIDGIYGCLCEKQECFDSAKKRVKDKKEKQNKENIIKTTKEANIPNKYGEIITDKKYLHLVDGTGLFIFGTSGTGKTVFGCSVGIEYIKKGKNVIFKSVAGLVLKIQDSYKSTEQSAFEILKELAVIDVLILDDLGAEKMTDFVRQSLYFLMNSSALFAIRSWE